MNARIEVTGKTTDDLCEALRETLRLVEAGCNVGHNSNDDGSFFFTVEGEEGSEDEPATDAVGVPA